MYDVEKLKKSIDTHKEADKEFFLDLLDWEKQREYEDAHIKNVMAMLKILYLLRYKKKISEAVKERESINSGHSAESYRRVLELDAQIAALKEKMNSYKPFFDEPYFARMDVEDDKEGYNSYYIGKRGDEGLEIVDWRAPLARKYYQKSRTS